MKQNKSNKLNKPFQMIWPMSALVLMAPCLNAAAQSNCVELANDAERLACYDRLHNRDKSVVGTNAVIHVPAMKAEALVPPVAPVAVNTESDSQRSFLSERVDGLTERWDLDPSNKNPRFLPRLYKPVYILPVAYSSRINKAPYSPTPGHQSDAMGLSPAEAKFQLSFKSKIFDGLLGDRATIWGGYTQSSRWQVYNDDLSRPFRETNYEPELMAVFSTPFEVMGWHGRMASVSLNHQSNGRSLPLSRSWNRVIGEVAAERGDWSLSLRPWWRIKEAAGADDNPGIENYIGRGELLLTRKTGEHIFTFQGRHSLRSGKESRGSVQLEWAFPLVAGLHGYAQVFSGYGESLIDYNFRQNRFGLGISLVEWR